MIKSISYDQDEIIKNILSLENIDQIDLDPTYSKGVFYKNIKKPRIKSDLIPKDESIIQSCSSSLSFLSDNEVNSIMFDPPFLAGYTKQSPSGKMGERFHGFRYIKDVWAYYAKSLAEFNRVLNKNGTLIFKCQDTVSSGRNHLSHVFIINEAEKLGFYCKDIFILLAKNRMTGHNHAKQKHARKFHSYFLVFKKEIK
jgi:hypothetical protein